MEPVQVQSKVPLKFRVPTFIGSCRLRLIFNDGNEALFGQCSGSLLAKIFFTRGKKSEAPVLEVGSFCEAAECSVLVGGEHANDRVFNNSVSSLPLLREYLKARGIYDFQGVHSQTTRIGNGVILSTGCLINVGAEVGNGAVIGSGAVVTRSPIPAWTIAGGVPARVLRTRLTVEQQEVANALEWWRWDLEFFFRNAHLLFDAEANYRRLLETRVICAARYRLVVKIEGGPKISGYALVGVEQDGDFIPLEHTSHGFQAYFSQMNAPEDQTLSWMANPFRLLAS